MPDRSKGDEAQIRLIMEQVAEAAIVQFTAQHPEIKSREAPVPPVIKWLVGAIAGFGSAALVGLGFWLVTSVSTMSNTLARMDERMKGADTAQVNRDAEQDRRIGTLEAFHKDGGR